MHRSRFERCRFLDRRLDVNLRVRQQDGSWQDARSATAKIYRILGGKAILELWDERVPAAGIRGFSLRHYDHEAGDRVLYLNWPGQNRSAPSSLRGAFRHGRGEFFSIYTNDAGDEVPPSDDTAHTYHSGDRCDLPQFRAIGRLAGASRRRRAEEGQ